MEIDILYEVARILLSGILTARILAAGILSPDIQAANLPKVSIPLGYYKNKVSLIIENMMSLIT